MSTRPAPKRLAILVLIVAAALAACERKYDEGDKVKAAAPRPGGRLPQVVPALGIRG